VRQSAQISDMESQRKTYLQSDQSLENLNPEEIRLSRADFEAVLAVVQDPPEPNEALKSGFRWYKALIS
jgi:hypothetical protein